MSFTLALQLPQSLSLQVVAHRREIYQKTGDVSPLQSPLAVMLTTNWPTKMLPPKADCPTHPAQASKPAIHQNGLWIQVEGLEELLASLKLPTGQFTGIFLSKQTDYAPDWKPMMIDDFRLTLYEINEETDLTTWTLLGQRRLWTGKNR